VRHRRIAATLLAVTASLGVAACGSSNSSSSKASGSAPSSTSASSGSTGGAAASTAKGTVNGAGSTLAQPIYQQWGSTLSSKGLTINYNGVGSGTGVADLQTATVDFAGSDPALAAADKKGMKGPVLQFPVAFGAITVSYNLPGIKSGLKLTGPVIAEIFSGKITKWNDSAITALNPGVNLPSTSITTVYRSDSSGTTDGFTTYLSDVDPAWKSSIGAGKLVKWPVGTGAAKNSGVAAAVKATTGAVGYVEQAYALENGFTYAAVQNGSSYVLPTIANTSAAASGITVPADLGISTIDSKTAGAYPIVSQTFLDAYRDPCKSGGASAGTAAALKSFLTYAFGAGQQTLGANSSNQLPYAPLPSSLDAKDNAQLATMTCNGSPIS
jgi:phosphate transport system substrate-binding protein